MPPQRVAVFVDYQNVYKGARAAFCPGSSDHRDGQIYPRRLGLKLKGNTPARELVGVFVYRGLPSTALDHKGYGAADRQVGLWRQQACVHPVTRPLNYRDPLHPREKGIDVKLAIDFVMMAQRGEYDIGVLMSDDTDLVPALEAVIQLRDDRACEIATWRADGGASKPLRVKGHVIQTHMLTRADYLHVWDDTDYTLRRRRR